MIGVPKSPPYTPGLVIVMVPFNTSSGRSLRVRARSARSAIASASPVSDFRCASLTTGTISPLSSATATPRLIGRL